MLGTLLWSQSACVHDAPSLSPHTGPYRVLTVEHIVLQDDAQHRNIPLKIYYPDAPGPFSVIVFSHGALASKDAYSGLGRYWASSAT
jgi:hypothetical protein